MAHTGYIDKNREGFTSFTSILKYDLLIRLSMTRS